MNNFTSVFVAILERLKLLTEDEAKKLVKELHSTTLPDNYDGASRLLDDIFSRHDIKSAPDKLTVNRDLKRTVDLISDKTLAKPK